MLQALGLCCWRCCRRLFAANPCRHPSALLSQVADRRVYFVHSYHATPSPEVRRGELNDWAGCSAGCCCAVAAWFDWECAVRAASAPPYSLLSPTPHPHPPTPQNAEWVLATSDYGGEFVAAVQRGNVCATQVGPPTRCYLPPCHEH